MTAAVIGVIGLIAGALITGLLDYRAARSNRRTRARVAGNLIATELELAIKRLDLARDKNRWWGQDFPSERWKANADALAVDVRRTLIDELAEAYAMLESWNLERAEGRDPVPNATQIKEIKDHRTRLNALKCRLRSEVRAPLSARVYKPIRFTAVAIAAVVVATPFLIAGFVQRPVLTDATIAAALQEKIAGPELVNCSDTTDRWVCDVTDSSPRCRVEVGRSAAVARTVYATYAAKGAGAGCGGGNGSGTIEVGEGPDGPVAVAKTSQIERQMHASAVRLDMPEKGWFERTFSRLFEDE
jgi:hypothetical protein